MIVFQSVYLLIHWFGYFWCMMLIPRSMIYLDTPSLMYCIPPVLCACVRWPISPLSSWLCPFKHSKKGAETSDEERKSCKLWRRADYQTDLLSPLKLYWPLSSLIMSEKVWRKTWRQRRQDKSENSKMSRGDSSGWRGERGGDDEVKLGLSRPCLWC